MSEGMIEKVTRAILECEGGTWPIKDDAWRSDYERKARAAIEAMREPTPEMLLAAWNSNGPAGDDDEYRLLWQAMIDAALNEGKS